MHRKICLRSVKDLSCVHSKKLLAWMLSILLAALIVQGIHADGVSSIQSVARSLYSVEKIFLAACAVVFGWKH